MFDEFGIELSGVAETTDRPRRKAAKSAKATKAAAAGRRPARAEAEAAVRTLIRWAGDDPTREGLLDTPATARTPPASWRAPSRKSRATTK